MLHFKGMSAIPSQYHSEPRGFTIVELLIVIVVIAILATITVVAYNGITQRAKDASAQADIHTIDESTKTFFSENGNYPLTLDDMKKSTVSMPLSKMVFSSLDDTNGGTITQNYTGSPRTPKGSYRVTTHKETINWYGGRVDTKYRFTLSYYKYQTNSWVSRSFYYGSTTWADPTLELTTYDDSVTEDNPGRDGDTSHNIPCTQQYLEDCLPTIRYE